MENDSQKESRYIDIEVEVGDINEHGKHGNVYGRLRDKHGNTSNSIQINSVWNFETKKTFSVPCSLNVDAVELWIEPGFWLKKCYLQQVTVESKPFPVNRWLILGEDTASSPAYIPKYGSALPEDDGNPKNRIRVIQGNQKWFEPVENVDGFAPQSKNVPPGEEFQVEYLGEILSKAIKGKLETIGDDVVDFLNPFDDNEIEKFTDYGQCYDGAFEMVPKGYFHWKSDRSFAMQRLIGVNPNVIELCAKLPANFNGTAEELETVLKPERLSLEDALTNKKIFMVNYEIMSNLTTQSYLGAPIALFYVTSKGNLMPLAIQLDQTAHAVVHLPTDEPNSWLLAKMLFNVADSNYHETVTHLGFTHLIAESILVALEHTIAPKHPVHLLLKPHFLYLMPINAAAFQLLVNKGGFFDKLMAIGTTGYAELLKRKYETWSLAVDGDLLGDLKNRGLDDPALLSEYHYREDATDIRSAIYEYVKEVLTAAYAGADGKYDERKFKKDHEIHNWAKLLLDPKSFNMKKVSNATRTEGFKDLEGLINTVTTTIFICSVQHAAVNFGQYDQYGFPPNCPFKVVKDVDAVHRKPAFCRILNETIIREPSEEEICKLLVNYNETMETLTITSTLSTRATQSLGYFDEDYLLTPYAVTALRKFRENLRKISSAIKVRNNERSYTYDYLDPSLIPNAISI